jgi:hypothetical protein
MNDTSIKSSPRYIQADAYDDEYSTDNARPRHAKRLSTINNQNLASISSNVNQRVEFSQSPLRHIKKGILS